MRPWLVGAIAWLVLALITATQNYVFLAWAERPIDVWTAIWRELIMFGTWGALTPPIVVVTRYARRSLRARLAHVPACVVTSVAHNVMLVVALSWIDAGRAPFGEQLISLLGRYFILDVVFYAGIAGVVEATYWSRKAADLERARVEALRAQLQPHFLFNALHAASSLIDSDPVAARRTIVRLSDLLRATLEIDRPVITLGEELALLERYIDIQRVRFSDRLTIDIDVPDELRRSAVPPLVLQPLVENAIKHGIGVRPGTISIRAARTGDRLQIVVGDDGAGLGTNLVERIGLGTTRERLAALHGNVTLRDRKPGVDAIVELPWRVA